MDLGEEEKYGIENSPNKKPVKHNENDQFKHTESLKEKSLNLLKQSIKKQAMDKFSVLGGDKSHAELLKTLQLSEELMQDLKYVVTFVVPCFPPSYSIFQIYFNNYKKVIMDRIESYLIDLDSILGTNPDIILVFNQFI